jgi:hypothetical protein
VEKQIDSHTFFFMGIVFFLTTISLAYHHHDMPFKYSTCSICKTKNALATSTKTNIDKSSPTVVIGLIETFRLDAAGMVIAADSDIFPVRESHHGSNRAPPLIQS